MKAADVTLTDYGLALESAAFAYLIHRAGWLPRPWVLMFFAGTSMATLAGWAIALRLCLDPRRARRLTTVAATERRPGWCAVFEQVEHQVAGQDGRQVVQGEGHLEAVDVAVARRLWEVSCNLTGLPSA